MPEYINPPLAMRKYNYERNIDNVQVFHFSMFLRDKEAIYNHCDKQSLVLGLGGQNIMP